MSEDTRKNIGARSAKPGAGRTSPSTAARSLAGGSAPRKPPTKAKPKAPADEPTKTPAAKAAPKADAKKAAPKKSAAKPAAKKSAGAKESARPTASASARSTATGRRLRAVTDDDAARAAAEAAEEAQRRTRSAGATPAAAGIPVDEIFAAVVQAAQRVLGSDWEARLATLLATVRRRLNGEYAVDDFGFDPQITEVLIGAVEPLAEKWFRLEVRGIENIPTDGGALLVANHSGTVPIDGVITGYAVKKYANRNLRPLGADLVFALPFVSQMARKLGATLACTEDAERLLSSGELAGVWPEGFKGIGKPYAERYKLQRFGRGGFVSSAMRAQVPIVPVSIVGAEEIYPLIGNVPSLARLLGVPYLPITPFFPLLGPLGLIPLPSKWIIEFGEPIRTDAYDPEAADDPMLLFNVTDQVRETIQQTLYKLLVDRGSAFF
ncbi:lysophospholipid acyltransferase family protein [Aeromicrobium sp. Leaf350]|uniref:lysophospholipid acyltransferase family protein n=1 Tax=Aeromicrobium sp. Leaf350 TaxID=2876565 RepID=UPI001E2ECC66|nr:lysophospholipid acyltransferase family protein [Aeromicrobium sp. Leaf350]